MSLFTSFIEKLINANLPSVIHPFLKNVFMDKKYLTKKLGNFLLNQFEMKLKKSYLISYPYYLVIDPTNICNLKCPLCPTWQDVKARPKGKMDKTFFYKLLEEVGPYLFTLNLCNWGEPLLNPDFPALISCAMKTEKACRLSIRHGTALITNWHED
jgi:MoaA/NifB/PqqE/SkfB family radical SAM enzyme